MTCKELTDFLDDYLAGDLTSEVRGRFEAHLGECPGCLVYMQGYRETVMLVRDLGRDPESDVPADVPADLVRAILDARRR